MTWKIILCWLLGHKLKVVYEDREERHYYPCLRCGIKPAWGRTEWEYKDLEELRILLSCRKNELRVLDLDIIVPTFDGDFSSF